MNIQFPAPQRIGTFAMRAHQVSSGIVTVLTDRTIRIDNFNYDGNGPGKLNITEVFFSVYCLH